ncbi:MAG: signal peptide peptidase SppA [Actinomycetota bacterium]|nr:signal peptide peptidase SppA [Actinomycetota bacterium]
MEEQKRKKLSGGAIAGIVIGSFLVLCIFCGCSFGLGLFISYLGKGANFSTADAIYQIDFEGQITDKATGSILTSGGITVEQFVTWLDMAVKNDSVKAILIRVDSPGGIATASQEMYEELKKVEKPVLISVSNICASGAYYVACAADKIMANKTSEIGSIGVIMQVPNLEGLYDKLGIKYTTIKQGKYKDAGSTDRELTEEERALLEEQTRCIYELFIGDVAAGRKLDVKKVRELATGWIYLGQDAKELGLIDEIGTYSDAVKEAAKMGGIKGEPRIIKTSSQGFFDMISGYASIISDLRELLALKNALDSGSVRYGYNIK